MKWRYVGAAALTPIVYVAVMLLLSGLVRQTTMDAITLTCITDVVLIVLAGTAYWKLHGDTEKRKARFGWGVLITILFWFVCAVIATSVYTYIGDSQYDTYVSAQSNNTGMSLLLTLVLAPIAEELLFRGLIYRQLMRAGAGFWISIGISSFVFSVFHGTLVHMIPALFMGAWFAMAYEYTGNLWCGMAVHAFYNLFSIAGSAIAIPDWFIYPWSACIMAALLVLFIVYFKEIVLSGKRIYYKGKPISLIPPFVKRIVAAMHETDEE